MKKSKARAKTQPARDQQSVNAIRETVEAFIPEFAARVAAIEHLLVEKNDCTYEDLQAARRFVDVQAELRRER